MPNPKWIRFSIDRGGTFTDVVTMTGAGAVRVQKIRSDRAVVGELAQGRLTFGTTVATNALLERRGVPTLLVTSAGFADLPWIRDQTRPSLFDPDATRPPPLCAGVLEIDGCVDAQGDVIEPLALDRTTLERALGHQAFEAVAVVLLNSHRCGDHERAVAEAVRALAPSVWITLGHELSPELGYLARVETALQYLDPARITLNPDCGFAPGSAAKVSLDEVATKLKNEVEAAHRLREKHS